MRTDVSQWYKEEAIRHPSRGDARVPKILIADDEPLMVQLLTLTLPSTTCEVIHAFNGREAVEVASEVVPDVILLDIAMPQLNGFEVLRQVRENPKLNRTKVIVISGRADSKDRERAFKLGADSYLGKPFSPLMLISKVDDMLQMI